MTSSSLIAHSVRRSVLSLTLGDVFPAQATYEMELVRSYVGITAVQSGTPQRGHGVAPRIIETYIGDENQQMRAAKGLEWSPSDR